MRVHRVVCAAIVAAMMPVAALADDPRDPAMASAAARARDREAIRQLNLRQLAMVRDRDARYAEGWRAYREYRTAAAEDQIAQSRDEERAQAKYDNDRSRYEQEMADWRRAVAACQRGDYAACND